MGMVEARSFLTVAVPLPSRDFPLLVTTGFDATPLDGPASPDLPAAVYDAYMDFMWLPKLADRWLGILAISPGVYSDFDDVQDNAWRFKGKALVKYDWVPNRVQVAAGILYLDRFTVDLAAGRRDHLGSQRRRASGDSLSASEVRVPLHGLGAA